MRSWTSTTALTLTFTGRLGIEDELPSGCSLPGAVTKALSVSKWSCRRTSLPRREPGGEEHGEEAAENSLEENLSLERIDLFFVFRGGRARKGGISATEPSPCACRL